MPDDAALVGCTFAKDRGEIIFHMRSESFRPVAEGEQVPELAPKRVPLDPV